MKSADDDLIRRHGKPLGRFAYTKMAARANHPGSYNWDWLPSPDGTHDGYVYRLGFYCLERQP